MRRRVHQHKRKIKSLILVICEGLTERVYTEYLSRLYRLPIEIKTRVSGANINSRLIQKYIQELKLGKDDRCKVFLMYDADVPATVNKLERLDETLVLTNPCIELWFLLHIKAHNRAMSSAGIVETLLQSHPSWKSYKKGALSKNQLLILKEGLGEAVARSRQLLKGQNPSTDMHEFITFLEKEQTV